MQPVTFRCMYCKILGINQAENGCQGPDGTLSACVLPISGSTARQYLEERGDHGIKPAEVQTLNSGIAIAE
jgi:hypothetical protein